ncbi:MAG: hypothetical protein ACRCXC_05500 [Legionella sp.]
MLYRIKQRLTNAAKILAYLPLEDKGYALCQIANRLLDVNSPIREPAVKRIMQEVTHRGSLKQMEYTIALTLAELLSNTKGARAFRKVAYATLRNRWNLISLCKEKIMHRNNGFEQSRE